MSLKDVMDRRQAKNQLNNDDIHCVLFSSEGPPMQGVQFVERIDTCTNKHASEAHKTMVLFLVVPVSIH